MYSDILRDYLGGDSGKELEITIQGFKVKGSGLRDLGAKGFRA